MSFSRSNLIIVIDGLSVEQLANLGQQIKQLPIPPIVTLASTVPILGKDLAEETQLRAKRDLGTAKEMLNFPAASEIVPGSNPRSTENFFIQGPFDAMIKRGSNGQLDISVKNFAATGIKELTGSMSVRDVSDYQSFQYGYKGVFAKPQVQPIVEKQLVVSHEHDIPKPKVKP